MFEILFIAYWSFALFAVFTVYKAINGYQNHHMVDQDDEFYSTNLERERDENYRDEIMGGFEKRLRESNNRIAKEFNIPNLIQGES